MIHQVAPKLTNVGAGWLGFGLMLLKILRAKARQIRSIFGTIDNNLTASLIRWIVNADRLRRFCLGRKNVAAEYARYSKTPD